MELIMPVCNKVGVRAAPKNLIELLQQQASRNPEGLAYTFLTNKDEFHITYAELEQDARAIASHLGKIAVALVSNLSISEFLGNFPVMSAKIV